MAVNPISFPQYGINSTVDPSMWSSLGNLGNVYKQAQADQRKQTALSALGGDQSADAATLIRSGDAGLVQLGINMRNRQTDQSREDARYAITDPRADAQLQIQQHADSRAANADVRAGYADLRAGNADAREAEKLKILQDKADRENRSLTEIFKERRDAWVSQGLEPTGPAYREYLTNEETTSNTAASKTGLSPIYGTRRNAKGEEETVMMQPTGNGVAVETALPPGVTISNKPIMQDTKTETIAIDPITRQVVGRWPKNIAGAAEQQTAGENIAKAKAQLPTIELNTAYLTKNIDDLVKHPGKSASLGLGSYFPTVAGSQASGFEARLDQVKGQAFLTAYDTLRGAGQISEGEGKAATAALTRARTATSVKEFDEAMADFREYVLSAANAARQKATGNVKTGQGGGADDVMAKALAAINSGADPKAVRQRLLSSGVDPGNIGL